MKERESRSSASSVERVRGACVATLFACGGALWACGGSAPPPKVAAEPPAESHEDHGPKLVMQQELGSIDEGAVEQTMNRLSDALESCHEKGRAKVEYLSGDVKVFLRIDQNGHVRYGHLEDSTLGDRDTEKCIMHVFTNAQWPRPEGGEAEVRHGFGWGPGGEREPVTWLPSKVLEALDDSKKVKKEVDACTDGTSGSFRVTAYVEPDGKHGKFQAIGVVPPSQDAAEKVDCVVEALQELELPSPGSYAAKVQFSL